MIVTHLNICEREERSFRLKMALHPAIICSNRNSYGVAIITEHMASDIVYVTNAVLWSMNRHSMMGTMAKGSMNTLNSPCSVMIPTITGNIVAAIMVN